MAPRALAWAVVGALGTSSPIAAAEPGERVRGTEAVSSAAPAPVDPASVAETGDSTLFLTGLYLTVLGGASVVGGLLYTAAGPAEYCPSCPSRQDVAVGYAALIGGFVATATGSALVVLGSRSEPGQPAGEPGPQLAVGLGAASLRVSF